MADIEQAYLAEAIMVGAMKLVDDKGKLASIELSSEQSMAIAAEALKHLDAVAPKTSGKVVRDELWNQAVEAAAREAEEWEGVETLLPLADAGANTAALIGQSEASEGIAEAIRKLKRAVDET